MTNALPQSMNLATCSGVHEGPSAEIPLHDGTCAQRVFGLRRDTHTQPPPWFNQTGVNKKIASNHILFFPLHCSQWFCYCGTISCMLECHIYRSADNAKHSMRFAFVICCSPPFACVSLSSSPNNHKLNAGGQVGDQANTNHAVQNSQGLGWHPQLP